MELNQITAILFNGPNSLCYSNGPNLIERDLRKEVDDAGRRIFLKDRIHDIVRIGIGGKRLLIFGGRSLALVNDSVSVVNLTDWIFAALPLKNGEFAVLYAHNVVQKISPTLGELENVHSAENCLLYSGALSGDCWETIRVAGGTIFGSILIWSPSSKRSLKLVGHSGAILSVAFSEDGESVISTAEDRSIRIFHISNLEDGLTQIGESLKLLGHTNKIWKARFFNEFIVSSSADATCRIWDRTSGLQLRVLEGHGVGNIWTFDCQDNLIVTGGGDSGIKVWSLDNDPKENSVVVGKATLAVLELDRVIVLNKDGALTIHRTDTSEIQILEDDSILEKVRTSSDGKWIVCSMKDGRFKVFYGAIRMTFQAHSFKCTDFFLQTDGESLLLFSSAACSVCYFKIYPNLDTLKVDSYTLDVPREMKLTSIHCIGGLVVVGTHRGSLLMYDLASSSSPCLVYRNYHSKESVDTVHLRIISIDEWFVYSGGRDGILAVATISRNVENCNNQKEVNLKIGWNFIPYAKQRITKGHVVRILSSNGTLWICCLYQKILTVLNHSDLSDFFKLQMESYLCDYDLLIRNKTIFLAFMRQNNLIIKIQTGPQSRILKESYHSLQTTAVRYLSFEEGTVLVSGGEDHMLTFHSLDMKVLNRQKVRSAIRAISYNAADGSIHKYSYCFVAGASSSITVLKVNFTDGILECLEVGSVEGTRGCLSRFMDISSIARQDGTHLVAAASSEGFIQLFSFKASSNGTVGVFDSLDVSRKHNRCVQKCKLIQTHEKILLITAATDGDIYIWTILDETLVFLLIVKTHQSGVKAMDVLSSQNLIYISTGGDDGAVSLVLIEMEESPVIIGSCTLHELHQSALVGCCLSLPSKLYTLGGDQRLFELKIVNSRGTLSLSLTKQTFIDISDASNMDCLVSPNGCTKVAVVGFGIQTLLQ